MFNAKLRAATPSVVALAAPEVAKVGEACAEGIVLMNEVSEEWFAAE